MIELHRKLPGSPEFKINFYHLLKSSSSISANYEEAQSGLTKADFKNTVKISFKEARETNFCLRLCKASMIINNLLDLDSLIDESNEQRKF